MKRYQKRMQELGLQFGDLPLYRGFWSYVPHLTTPLRYISAMSLTFEMANLDFAPIYSQLFAEHGDLLSSELMQGIFEDEIGHVSFGCRWLKNWKDPQHSAWETWKAHLPPRTPPSQARAPLFFSQHRRLAGLDEEWIKNLELSAPG